MDLRRGSWPSAALPAESPKQCSRPCSAFSLIRGNGFKGRVWGLRLGSEGLGFGLSLFRTFRCQVTAQSGLISYGRILIRAKPSFSWQTTPKPSSFLLSHSYHHHIPSDSLHSTQRLSRRGRFRCSDSLSIQS